MTNATRPHDTDDIQDRDDPADERAAPDISVCESRPGRTVFIEADNTEGWIASDTTVDVSR